MSPESPPRELSAEEMRRSAAVSPREVCWSATMLGLTDPFMIPYALALGGTAFQAGLLTSVRNLILSVAQLKTADAMHWFRSRRRLVLWSVAVQIASFVPLIFLGLRPGPAAVASLILLYTLGTTSSAFSGPAWASLVGSYIAPEVRGAYFGRLFRLVGFWSTLATLAAGGLLALLHQRALLGFGLLAAGAAVARTFSWRLLRQLAEGPQPEEREAHFTFWEFLRRTRASNFVHFALAIAGISFAVNLAAPFFAVWVIRELHYSYFVYALTQLSISLTSAMVMPAWGRAGDRVGNRAILWWTTIGVAIMPFLWPVLSSPAELVGLSLASGFFWGGFNLCITNFVFDAATPARRAHCFAYFNVLNGCGVSLGALTGGWLVGRLPAWGGSAFATLFFLSGTLRVVGALVFRAWVREVKPVEMPRFRDVVVDVARMPVSEVLDLLPLRAGEERRPPE